MDAFDWMMKKTATIPEIRRIDEELFFNYSHSTPSIFKKFHVLIYLISIYHILFSKYIIWKENLYEVLDPGWKKIWKFFVFQIFQMYGVN